MNPNRKQKQRYNSALKYSGMAVQMAVIITLGVFLGWKLDQMLHFSVPVLTLVLSLFSIAAAIYLSIKDFLKPKK